MSRRLLLACCRKRYPDAKQCGYCRKSTLKNKNTLYLNGSQLARKEKVITFCKVLNTTRWHES
ncbi:hypothetical protein KCP73_19530 [Salmonella enterica subsp. enterica]|nr:hypothetical protein KCP73_19530 [Salmonella enterica subsp. enterica]